MSLVVSELLCSLHRVIIILILESFFSFRIESSLEYMRLHLYQQRARGNTLLGYMNGIDRADGGGPCACGPTGAFCCGVMSLSVRLLRVGFGRSCHSGSSLWGVIWDCTEIYQDELLHSWGAWRARADGVHGHVFVASLQCDVLFLCYSNRKLYGDSETWSIGVRGYVVR